MLKGHFDLLVMAAVAQGPAHGYALIERIRERSSGTFDFPEGTVYPALYRLEADGFLASSWTTVNGRRRRVYRLTRRGRKELGREREEWKEFARAVEAVVT